MKDFDELERLRISKERQEKKGRRGRIWKIVIITAVIGGCGYFILSYTIKKGRNSAQSKETEMEKTGIAQKDSHTESGYRASLLPLSEPIIKGNGYIEAKTEVLISAKIMGKIKDLFVEKGSIVKKGEIIAVIDDKELKGEVEFKQAELEVAIARLEDIKQGTRPQEIREAEALLQSFQAELKNIEKRLTRIKEMYAENAVGEAELDNIKAEYDMAKAKLVAQEERLSLLKEGPTNEEVVIMEKEVKKARADLLLAQTRLNNTVITSPINGTIIDTYVKEGDMVFPLTPKDKRSGSAIALLMDLQSLEVAVDINEHDIGKIEKGMKIMVIPEAFPNRLYAGRVVEISPFADRDKNTIEVRGSLMGDAQGLIPNMNAKVLFYALSEYKRYPLIPKEYISLIEGKQVVFIRKGDAVIKREVTIGNVYKDKVEIVDGIIEGDEIIPNIYSNKGDYNG